MPSFCKLDMNNLHEILPLQCNYCYLKFLHELSKTDSNSGCTGNAYVHFNSKYVSSWGNSRYLFYTWNWGLISIKYLPSSRRKRFFSNLFYSGIFNYFYLCFFWKGTQRFLWVMQWNNFFHVLWCRLWQICANILWKCFSNYTTVSCLGCRNVKM